MRLQSFLLISVMVSTLERFFADGVLVYTILAILSKILLSLLRYYDVKDYDFTQRLSTRSLLSKKLFLNVSPEFALSDG